MFDLISKKYRMFIYLLFKMTKIAILLLFFQMKAFPNKNFKNMLIVIVFVYVICCLLVEVSPSFPICVSLFFFFLFISLPIF